MTTLHFFRNARHACLGVILVLALVSCNGTYVPPPAVYQPTSGSVGPLSAGTEVDASRIKSIAVLPFENFTDVPRAGELVADDLESVLVNRTSYKVVTRAALQDVLRERDLVLERAIGEDTAIQIGKLTGADILICGSVQYYGVERAAWTEKEVQDTVWKYEIIPRTFAKRVGRIVLQAKLISTQSGTVLWSKRIDSWWGWDRANLENRLVAETTDFDLLVNARAAAATDIIRRIGR